MKKATTLTHDQPASSNGVSNGTGFHNPGSQAVTPVDRNVIAQFPTEPPVEEYANHRHAITDCLKRTAAAAAKNAALRMAQLRDLTFQVLFKTLDGLDAFVVRSAFAMPRGLNLVFAFLLTVLLLGAIAAEVNNLRIYALDIFQDAGAAFCAAIIAVFVAAFYHLAGHDVPDWARRCIKGFVLVVGTITSVGYGIIFALLCGPARPPGGMTVNGLRTALLMDQSVFIPCLCFVILVALGKLFPVKKEVETDPEHAARSAAASAYAAEIQQHESKIAEADAAMETSESEKYLNAKRILAVWNKDRETARAEAEQMNTLMSARR